MAAHSSRFTWNEHRARNVVRAQSFVVSTADLSMDHGAVCRVRFWRTCASFRGKCGVRTRNVPGPWRIQARLGGHDGCDAHDSAWIDDSSWSDRLVVHVSTSEIVTKTNLHGGSSISPDFRLLNISNA